MIYTLFTEELKIFNRVLTPDESGGDSISFVESPALWLARVSSLDGEYSEDAPGREYPAGIRIVGQVRDDIREGDRIEHSGFTWEITSLALIKGIGSIPDYLRAKAVRIVDGGA